MKGLPVGTLEAVCHQVEEISVSDRFGAREQTAVDGIHNRCGADHPSAEVAAIEALDGVLATLDLVELEVDVALRVGI